MEENYDSLLTRFTENLPCWNAGLLEQAGESPEGLETLRRRGLLEESCGAFWLTQSGQEAFRRAAAEFFLDELPGGTPKDCKRSLSRTRLWLDLERGHIQRWGIKDYRFNLNIPVRPQMDGPLWERAGASIRWLYLDHPAFMEGERDFPKVSIAARSLLGGLERRDCWEKRFPPMTEFLNPDLLYLCRYDFEQYTDFPGYPGDKLKLVNTDRFFFSFEEDLDKQLDLLAFYHLWLLELRRAGIPGYLDVDTQEQDSVNWLLFVTEREEDALRCAGKLRTFGDELIRPANPMELWVLSLEALEAYPPKQEVIWELLPQTGHAVCRTLQR